MCDCETNCATPTPPPDGAPRLTRDRFARAGAELMAECAPEILLTATDPARAALERLGWRDAARASYPEPCMGSAQACEIFGRTDPLEDLRKRVEELERRTRSSMIVAPSPEWINRVKASRNDPPDPRFFQIHSMFDAWRLHEIER